jgi:hypothetical protein
LTNFSLCLASCDRAGCDGAKIFETSCEEQPCDDIRILRTQPAPTLGVVGAGLAVLAATFAGVARRVRRRRR